MGTAGVFLQRSVLGQPGTTSCSQQAGQLSQGSAGLGQEGKLCPPFLLWESPLAPPAGSLA